MVIDAIVTRAISFKLQCYRMQDGAYSDAPCATRTLRVGVPPVESGHAGAYFPPVLVGDFNGDGRADLLLGRGTKELRLYFGVPGPDLLTKHPQRMKITVPRDEEFTWMVDLNRDGRQDVLMHHPSTCEPHRVTLLIAQ
jgi:hypothetical protein